MAALAVLVKRLWLDLVGRPKPAVDAAFFQELASMSQTGTVNGSGLGGQHI
jgi:hypothetical protein